MVIYQLGKMYAEDGTCRVCLGKHHLNSIFGKNLSEKIMYCASVQIVEDDNLPKMICNQCLFYLDIAYIFRTVCEATNQKLQNYSEELPIANQYKCPSDADTNEENSDSFYFNNSPVAHEIVLDEDGKNHNESGDDKEIEISLEQTTDQTHVDTLEGVKDSLKDKVGRHVAKKNAGKCPKRFLPQAKDMNEDRISQNEVPEAEDSGANMREGLAVKEQEQISPEENNEQAQERKTFQCQTCNKFFPFKSHLTRHLSVHSGVKQYTCHHCNKKFINRYNLSVHMQKHTGNFPLKCKLCGRGFSSPSLLKRHLNSHTGVSKFQCKYCPKKLLYLSSLKVHEKMHLYRPSYTCDVCFKVFSYTNSLTEHKKTHLGLKEYVCGVCCKQFTRKTSLKRHMIGHSRANRIKCKHCGLSFSTNNYKIHLNSHKRNRKHQEKSMKCEECHESFTSKAQLIKHLRQHVGINDR
ncbi:unnamed protein product [Tenebrio molitor]|jgi:hypothetical protein|nr:unnamed protein product [Tenebrio molitor]